MKKFAVYLDLKENGKSDSYHWIVSDFMGLFEVVQGLGLQMSDKDHTATFNSLGDAYLQATKILCYLMLGEEAVIKYNNKVMTVSAEEMK